MGWYQYVASFLAGVCLTNAVPHFVRGICGERFPTVFASPPFKGLSSPTVNILWALLNLVAGAILFRVGTGSIAQLQPFVALFAGIAGASLTLSAVFAKNDRD